MTPTTDRRAPLLARALEAWLSVRLQPPASGPAAPTRPPAATPSPAGRPTCEDTLCLSTQAPGGGGCTPAAAPPPRTPDGAGAALEALLHELLSRSAPEAPWLPARAAACPPGPASPEAVPDAPAPTPAVVAAPPSLQPEEPPLAQLGRRAVNTAINAAVGVAAGGLLGLLAGLASPVLGVAVGLFTVAAVATTGVEWVKRPT
ncbi:MAG: hypothetical protein VKQ33_00155 [Candidatus Sericytochromatia bacterium]|nr:hypothetical protein [Candidatus Sericytochromatia bacterium]